MPETPFGYIILEGENDIKEVRNLEVIDKPHLFYVRFDTVLQSLDCKNRNGRQYNGDAMVKALSNNKIAELIANNKWKGERDHPITKDIQRIATISSKCESHRIVKWWRDGNLIKGTIETLDDGDGCYGTQLTKNILQGENPSFSLRALAMLDRQGTVVMVNKPPRVITYDEVNLPSHEEAYALPKKTKVISDGSSEITYESCGYQNGALAIQPNDIKDMITHKSDNLKIVCESFDIDPASLEVCNQGRSLSLKRGGEKFIFALEHNIAREINEYYRMR